MSMTQSNETGINTPYNKTARLKSKPIDLEPLSSALSLQDPLRKDIVAHSFNASILLMSCLLGLVVGVIFIIIQPLFGMDTLTSRHADAYQVLGGWNSPSAISMAWASHLLVSIFYGLISGLVMLKTARSGWIVLSIVTFTWVTTIIAPPANAMIIQLVSFQEINASKLPSFNFNLDVKFILHLLFFAAISAGLYFYKKHYAIKKSDHK